MKLSITIPNYSDFLDMDEEWNDLLEETTSNQVFFTHEWIRCWWDAFLSDGNQPYMVCVRADGKLVGVAPFYLSKSKFRGFPIIKLSFMANEYTAESGFILSKPEKPILTAIFNYLAKQRKKWHLLDLTLIHNRNIEILNEVLSDCGFKYFVRESGDIPYIKIDSDWSTYYSQRSRRFKKIYNRRKNLIKRNNVNVRIKKIDSKDKLLEVLPHIFKISANSWKAENEKALISNDEVTTFFEIITAIFGDRGWVEIWIVYFGDIAVAFEYHLKYKGVTNPIRADFDENFKDLSPGAYLESEILRSLFENPDHQITEYNTCASSYPYIMRLTNLVRSKIQVWVLTPTFYGRLLHPLGLIKRFEKKIKDKGLISCREL